MEKINLIKKTNRQEVLKHILKNKTFTKRSIESESGISFPTVSKIFDEMESENMVLVCGETSPINGRRASVYRVNPDYKHALIIRFQGDRFVIIRSNSIGEVLSVEVEKLRGNYLQFIHELVKDRIQIDALIKVLIIGIPGSVVDNKITCITNYDELMNVDIATSIVSTFNIKTILIHDMYALLVGISEKPQYHSEEDIALAILTKDGPGCKIKSGGNILKGFNGFAGEVGFLTTYNEYNLQKIAENEFRNYDIVDYTARLIACVCSVTNPKVFVMIDNDYLPDIDKIYNACLSYIPQLAMPSIKNGGSYDELYDSGLLKIAFDSVFA